MTRERDEALAVVAEYKFGQTASARILRERDAALSRAEALEKAVREERAVFFTKDSVLRMDEILAVRAQLRKEILDAALAAPSEPKEGA
jgi:hypothetical protein